MVKRTHSRRSGRAIATALATVFCACSGGAVTNNQVDASAPGDASQDVRSDDDGNQLLADSGPERTDAGAWDGAPDGNPLEVGDTSSLADVANDEGPETEASDAAGNCNQDPVANVLCTSKGLKFLWICEAGGSP